MRSRLALTEARLYFPLTRLALCPDCEVCFEISMEACPACGGETWSPLSRLIGNAAENAVVRAVQAVVAETRCGGDHDEAHHLVIVSRDQPKLYEMLRRELQDSHEVQVILDRRRGVRPDGAAHLRANLRWRNVDRQIKAMGWAIVRSEVPTAKR
jgi:hypothetical protein